MVDQKRILLVEDSEPLARTYERYLRTEPYEVIHAADGATALEVIDEGPLDSVILDLRLPDMDSLEILRRIRTLDPEPAVVALTVDGQISAAVEAMREGAFDFLVKPFSADRLATTLRNAVDHQQLTEIVDTYRKEYARQKYFGFTGSSPVMQSVFRVIEAAAVSDATVFITGESGTGKELCAEAIHMSSPRCDRPLVAINCAAIPKDLVESEIFGHVKGAFTGAVNDREGAAKAADGGTLFLDEICEMPLDFQAKLLRFVQTGTYTRVGDTRPRKADTRFVCATNRNPVEEVAGGRFRQDLFYRLHVIPIHLPALRERGGDIVILARQFLTEYASAEGKTFRDFSKQVEHELVRYSWPGNVRELQNLVRNVVVLHDAEVVTKEMIGLDGISPAIAGGHDRRVVPDRRKNSTPVNDAHSDKSVDVELGPLWQMEMQCIEHALSVADGNVPRAAAMLQISPSTVYRKRHFWRSQESEKLGES